MKEIDPDKIRVILATDCGSTTTKAILIQKVDGVYRQTHRGEAPTTVEEPLADVTMGVVNAVTEVREPRPPPSSATRHRRSKSKCRGRSLQLPRVG